MSSFIGTVQAPSARRFVHPATRRTVGLAVVLAAGGALSACGPKGDAVAATGEPTAQQVGTENITLVTTDSIIGGPLLSGALVPAREARLRAEVGGRVTAMLVEPGQRVAAGTVLVRIDDSALRDDVLSARSSLASAELAATQASRELERARTLAAAGAIATREVEGAERADLQARAALEDAKARLAAREKSLGNTEVRAPFAGVVSERTVSIGDIVSPGGALLTVVDPSSLRLEGAVPATAIGRVRVGAPVSFTVSGYEGRTFGGRVTQVSPVADPVTRQVRMLASLTNDAGTLVGGLFAEGRVASEQHEGLVVAEVAVDQRGVAPFVTRVRNGVVERVEVTLGVRDAVRERVELLTGVNLGDTLLVGAAKAITVGTPIVVNDPQDTPRNAVRP
jgi:RND family efflux transporter MFP subunit